MRGLRLVGAAKRRADERMVERSMMGSSSFKLSFRSLRAFARIWKLVTELDASAMVISA